MLTFCQNMPFFFQQFSLGISQLNVVGQEYFFCIQGPLGCRKQAGAIPSSPCLVSSSRRASQRPILGQPLRLPVPGHETPGLAPPHPRQVQRIVHRASVSEPVTDSFLPAAGDRSPGFILAGFLGPVQQPCNSGLKDFLILIPSVSSIPTFGGCIVIWSCAPYVYVEGVSICVYMLVFFPRFFTHMLYKCTDKNGILLHIYMPPPLCSTGGDAKQHRSVLH